MDDLPSEHAPLRMRESRAWALVAWFLLATSLWLSWWRIRFQDPFGTVIDQVDVRHFQDGAPFAHTGAVVGTTVLVALALLVLFIRLAGRSWLHEPPQWRRDLAVTAGLVLLALASCWFWPTGEAVAPRFWGGVVFAANGTGGFEVRAGPGLGWWTGVVAGLCLAMSMWRATSRK